MGAVKKSYYYIHSKGLRDYSNLYINRHQKNGGDFWV